jgi:pyridoxamine 5'-phosphate oxidase
MRPPLPEPLPESPLPLLADWLAEAGRVAPNATAMTLATVDARGLPSARMVICRGFDPALGWFVFYTDRESAKGRALHVHPHAALVFYWEALGRQVRIEGPVTPAPDAQTDQYWGTRPLDARLAAIATLQGRPLASRAVLVARFEQTVRELGGSTPRPDRWVGYRVWARRIELWVSQPARLHDRAVWTRSLERAGEELAGGPWDATRLEP